MAITSSGVISLSDFNTELGNSSTAQISLNDTDVRDLIGKASGATASMSEYYGAAATDAVASFNGNVDVAYMRPGGNQIIQPTGSLINSYSIASRTGEHVWPVSSADNQPYPFTSSTTLKALPGGTQCPDMNRAYVTSFGISPPNANMYSNLQYERSIGNFPNDFNIRSGGAVFPLQKIQTGSNRFRFTVQVAAMGSLGRANKVTVKIVQAENCVTVGGNTHAVASGNQIVTQLFTRTEYGPYDPISNPSGSQGQYTQSVDTTFTTTYEWLWIEVIAGTSSYQSHQVSIKDIFIN